MSKLKPCPVKLIDANALKRKIQQTYLPSDSLTAGVLYDLISTAPPIEPSRRAQPANEPLTCEGCEFYDTVDGCEPCTECSRLVRVNDCYTRKPERSENDERKDRR